MKPTNYNKHQQKGAVLAISMIMLLVCTLLGISALKGSQMSERLASNTQQKAITFEASESAIDAAWSIPTVVSALKTLNSGDEDILELTVLDTISEQLSIELDQSNQYGSTVDISIETTFQYCGETSKPAGNSLSADESGLQLVGVLFNTGGQSTIANSRAESRHIKRGYIVRPASGLSSNCLAMSR